MTRPATAETEKTVSDPILQELLLQQKREEAQQAIATARAAAAKADQERRNAGIESGETKGRAGTVESGAESGYLAELIAYGGLELAIRKKVESWSKHFDENNDGVLVTTEQDQLAPALDLDLLLGELRAMNQGVCSARNALEEIRPPGAVAEDAGASAVLGGLSIAGDLISYFRSDYAVSGVGIDADEDAVRALFAGALGERARLADLAWWTPDPRSEPPAACTAVRDEPPPSGGGAAEGDARTQSAGSLLAALHMLRTSMNELRSTRTRATERLSQADRQIEVLRTLTTARASRMELAAGEDDDAGATHRRALQVAALGGQISVLLAQATDVDNGAERDAEAKVKDARRALAAADEDGREAALQNLRDVEIQLARERSAVDTHIASSLATHVELRTRLAAAMTASGALLESTAEGIGASMAPGESGPSRFVKALRQERIQNSGVRWILVVGAVSGGGESIIRTGVFRRPSIGLVGGTLVHYTLVKACTGVVLEAGVIRGLGSGRFDLGENALKISSTD